jgi:hypothetical protein
MGKMNMKSETKLSPIMTAEQCSGLSDDELKLMANTFGEKCQQAAKKTVEDAITAGTALLVMRERVPHGEWSKWLASNWDYTRQTAQTYLTLAVNVKRFTNRTPDSIREAMRVIADQPADKAEQTEIVPRAERKTGRVEVEKVGQTVVQADAVKPEKDSDPTPAPKTTTKHSAATAKAREADRPAPQIVTPVIVEEPAATKEPDDPFRYCTFDTIIEIAIGKLSDSDDQRKQAAKRLRKLADKLDPPKPSAKFQRPDLDECLQFFQEHNNDEGETFFDFYESKGWLVGKVSMKDWKAAGRKWIRENQHNGKGISNGKQSAAQAREQGNADAFAQLRLAISNQQSGET